VSVFFYQFVNGLIERYPELYDGDGASSQHQANFGKKWKSYQTIYELASGDIKKIDEVVEEPLEKCLLFLSYKSDKIRIETLMHKESLKGIK
jgi:hypothetical protein